jgi:putative tryptophan/tyrosine transport system substrate-binding protein
MRRREFIGLVGSAAAWPLRAEAQHSKLPVIGYINSRSPTDSADIVAAFREGLKEAGFVEGKNVTVESRFAAGDFARFTELAADLLLHEPDVIVATGGTVSVVKIKPVVPSNIPIVFAMGGDPVKLGIVNSLDHPGGNLTGISFLVTGLASKQIELLHELIPRGSVVGFLVNPKDPNAKPDISDAGAAADSLQLKLVVGEASAENELENAFNSFSKQQVTAVFVDAEPFLLDQHKKIIALAVQRSLALVSQFRTFAINGALASYGTSLTEANRQLGSIQAVF